MTRDDFASAYDRILDATGCRTQVELAARLGIRQSSISDAKRRATVPAAWLVRLLADFGLNPVWIQTGHGPKFMRGSDRPDEHAPGEWSRPPAPEPDPVTVSDLIAAIRVREPGARVFVAIGDPEALDLAGLRALAEAPAPARAGQ